MPLASAAVRCAGRRLTRPVAAHPAVALLGAAVVLGALCLGVRAGMELARLLEASLDDPAVTRALVVGITLVGVSVGAALGASLPGLGALGHQLACAPATAVDRMAAVLWVPFALVLVAPALVTLPLAAPVALAGPAGGWSTVMLAAPLVAGAATGGLLAALTRAVAPTRTPSAVVPALGIAAPVVALCGIAVLLAGDALAGRAAPVVAVVACALTAAIGLAVWGRAAIAPAGGATRARRSRALRGRPFRVVTSVAALLLVRRGDVRVALGGGVLLGFAGLAIAEAGAAPPPTGLVLAVTGAALTAAPCPLAVGGVLRDGRHVWWLAGLAPLALALAWMTASTPGLVVPAAIALLAVLLGAGGPSDLLAAFGLAVVVWAAALAAGAVAPWRRHGVADQALALGLLGLLIGGASFGASRLGPLLVGLGLPDFVAGSVLVASAPAVALTVLVGRLGGPV